MRFAKNKKKSNQKKLILGGVLILLAAGGCIYLLHGHNKKTVADQYPDSLHQKVAGPTAQEKKDTEAHKDELVAQMKADEQAKQNPPTGKKQVTPIITNASLSQGSVTVNSFISGVVEDGGTCTVIATQGSKQITKSGKAFANATTTNCAPISTNTSEFPSTGSWSIKIQYSSNNSEGVSQAQNITI